MNFYTDILNVGNDILYRGYENGKRVQYRDKHKPTLYLENKNKNSNFKSLDNRYLHPKTFDSISSARKFVKDFADVDNFEYFGMANWVLSYIADKFKGELKFNFEDLCIGYVDIEVEKGNGYSQPEDANNPITSIVLHARDRYIVFGLKHYAPEKDNEVFMLCDDEADLLRKFIRVWNVVDMDIISGWYIEGFDIPYLINRIEKVLGEGMSKKLSPWEMINRREIRKDFGNVSYIYDICGIQILDWQALFMKFTYETPENNKLDTVAHMLLDEKKIDYSEFKDLDELYEKNYQKFIRYNIRDVALVQRMEEKIKLIFLVCTIAYSAKINFIDSFKQTVIWDSIIYNYLLDKNIVVPQKKINTSTRRFAGGFVKQPRPAKHKWMVSFDLTSLYPSLYMHYNISPETYVGRSTSIAFKPDVIDDKDTANKILVNGLDYNEPRVLKENLSVAANGTLYRKDFRGFVPEIIERVFNERQRYKKLMIAAKKKLEENRDTLTDAEKKSIEYDISVYDVMQQNFKIQINALYGSFGNAGFRFYNVDNAEAITLSGQLSVRWIERKLNEFLNQKLNTDTDYVKIIDTDSVYLDFSSLVEKMKFKNDQEAHDFIQKFSIEVVQVKIAEFFDELSEYMNSYDKRLHMKLEKICRGLVVVAKKRYFCDVMSNEGVLYGEPKIEVTGIEAVRSTTPEFCRKKLKEAFAIILRRTEKESQDFIEKVKDEFMKLEPEDIAIPKGVNGLKKYSDSLNIYSKGTPMHVRASLLYNKFLEDKGMEKKFDRIVEGEKIRYVYMKLPNPVRENVFAFPVFLPREFGVHDYIDKNTQFQKVFTDPLETIFDAIGWNIEERSTLEDLFS